MKTNRSLPGAAVIIAVSMPLDATQIDDLGFAIVRRAIPATMLQHLRDLAGHQEAQGPRRGGVRNLLDDAQFVQLARSPEARNLVESILGARCWAVRGILFEKSHAANWNVAWHQDVTIAVRRRRDAPGFVGWSEKQGVTHVQPPVEILERMLALRIHLDDCTEDHGPLRILPRSHTHGRLGSAAIQRWTTQPYTLCAVEAGDIVLMRPLALHASATAERPNRRRVIHIEFSADRQPLPLQWRWAV